MVDTAAESKANGSDANVYELIGSMFKSLTEAIKELPSWQRIVGFALVVAAIPITLAVYSLSSDPNKQVLLSVIFLVWISSLIFVVYAFTARQGQLKKKSRALKDTNDELEERRTSLVDQAVGNQKSLKEIRSRLEAISTEMGSLLQNHPEITSNITNLNYSVDSLIRNIKEKEESCGSFLGSMIGGEEMRETSDAAASFLVKSSRKS
jgi:methyl-accepting chemotaxis protein